MNYLIILETLAVLSLLTFYGIMDGKYYEKLSVNIVPRLIRVPFYLLLVTELLTLMSQHDVKWNFCVETLIVAHTMLLFVNGVFLILALTKFADIPFKYAKQYLLARGALYFAVVFEGFALGTFVACCVLQLF